MLGFFLTGMHANRAPIWRDAQGLPVRTGDRFDLYDHQDRSLGQWITVGLDPVPCQLFTAILPRSFTSLRAFRRQLRREGIANLSLAEEGFLLGGLKWRQLRLARSPRRQQPTVWPDTQGV